MPRDAPIWPFAWRGLPLPLALLGLVLQALWPMARSEIEATVRTRLNAKGHAWAGSVVSGQNVHLSGAAPDVAVGEAALGVARQAACPSAWGWQTCAELVTAEFDAAPAPSAAIQPQSPVDLQPVLHRLVDVQAAVRGIDIPQTRPSDRGPVPAAACAIRLSKNEPVVLDPTHLRIVGV